jgi:hypothetical protein
MIAEIWKPVWQYVLEAAQSLKSETFSPTDIIRKVHETNSEIQTLQYGPMLSLWRLTIILVDIGRLLVGCMGI